MLAKKFADILPDAIVAINATGDLLWCNLSAHKLFGAMREANIAVNVKELVYFQNFSGFLEGQLYDSLESNLIKSADTHILVKLIQRTKKSFILLLRDITHLHYLEKMRQDFVANVSHELRTPLTVIHGYLEILLSEQTSQAKPWQKIFTQMYQQGLRMEKLVEDLLLLSRLESQSIEDSPRPISLKQLLKPICEDAMMLSAERSHKITMTVSPEVYLMGNEGELHAAFSNIIFNAVHYTPAGGEVNIHWNTIRNAGVLQVDDTGIGIALEDINRITERFYRVDKGRSRESGGTGLGLAIVKHVLIRHEAYLEIESREHQGSSFKCVFPHHRVVARGFKP